VAEKLLHRTGAKPGDAAENPAGRAKPEIRSIGVSKLFGELNPGRSPLRRSETQGKQFFKTQRNKLRGRYRQKAMNPRIHMATDLPFERPVRQ
jgi:hypothetical protein